MLPIPGQTADWVWNEQSKMFHLVVGTEADDTEKGVVVPITVNLDDKHYLFNEGELSMFPGDIDRYRYNFPVIISLRRNPQNQSQYAFNSTDGTVYIYNATNSHFNQVKALMSGSGVDWSSDGVIASGSCEGTIALINSENGQINQQYNDISCVIRVRSDNISMILCRIYRGVVKQLKLNLVLLAKME